VYTHSSLSCWVQWMVMCSHGWPAVQYDGIWGYQFSLKWVIYEFYINLTLVTYDVYKSLKLIQFQLPAKNTRLIHVHCGFHNKYKRYGTGWGVGYICYNRFCPSLKGKLSCHGQYLNGTVEKVYQVRLGELFLGILLSPLLAQNRLKTCMILPTCGVPC
jgi:hypothetical protein